MGITAYKQIKVGTVTLALLAADVQASLAKVDVNETDIAAINAAKGQPNGFATLNAAGSVTASQVNSIALHGFAGEVSNEADMLALTTNTDGSAIEIGDRCDRLDEGRTYIFSGGDLTDAANWRKILAENASVTSMRNTSGSVVGETGVVTLADVAFSGSAADVAGLAAVATTGSAADVAVADAGDKFTATEVESVLAEIQGNVEQEATDRIAAVSTAISTAAGATATAKDEAISASTLIEGTLTGAQDDNNTSFVIGNLNTNKPVFLYRDGIEHISAGFATQNGAAIETILSAPASDESMKVFGYPN